MLAGCGPLPPSAEHQSLTDFFEASRVRDTTLLARTSSVIFEPRTDGVVQAFEITNGGEEQGAADGGVTREVTVRAEVRMPSGQVVTKVLMVALRRDADDRGWFITGFRQPPASQTSPAASSAPRR